MTPQERNDRAAARARAEGHRAILDNGTIKVVSDTDRELFYRVSAISLGGPVTFVCCPQRRSTGRPDATRTHGHLSAPGGVVRCKHQAVAANRLRREGLIEQDDDGRWVTSDRLIAQLAEREAVADVFASFPA